jgi:hypothetical protein
VAEEIAKMSRSYPRFDPPVNLDWEYYLAASHSGQCFAVAVYDGDFIGGSVFFISTNPNHKNILEATNSIIFLEEKHRGRIAIELFKKAHEFLKEFGVQEISYTLKDERIGRLLARSGFKPEATVWSIK